MRNLGVSILAILSLTAVSATAQAMGKARRHHHPQPVPTVTPTPTPPPTPDPTPTPTPTPTPLTGCKLLDPSADNGASCQQTLRSLFENAATEPEFSLVDGKIFRMPRGEGSDDSTISVIGGQLMLWETWSPDSEAVDFVLSHTLSESESRETVYRDGMLYSQVLAPNPHGGSDYGLKRYNDFLISVYGVYEGASKFSQKSATFGIVPISAAIYSMPLESDDLGYLLSVLTNPKETPIKRAAALQRIRATDQIKQAVLPIIDLITTSDWSSSKDSKGLYRMLLNSLISSKDSRAAEFLLNQLSDWTLSVESKARIITELDVSSNEELSRKFEVALIQLIRSDELGANAVARLSLLKSKAAVLPLTDIVKEFLDSGTLGKDVLLRTVNALGEIASDRALPVLRDSRLNDDKTDKDIRKAVKLAITKIETVVEIEKIKSGDGEAIKWGMNIITYGDGSVRALIFQILQALSQTAALPQEKASVAEYLRSEISSGYHDYDQEMVQKMKEVADMLSVQESHG